jgi:response regulator RpfG family c-di-GMP phosphodiesterase
VLSGYADIDSVTGAINRGEVFRYLTKPWDPEELRQEVRMAFERFNDHLPSPHLS